eukprot:1141024-Pelagomonas_calceolata.AAC.1
MPVIQPSIIRIISSCNVFGQGTENSEECTDDYHAPLVNSVPVSAMLLLFMPPTGGAASSNGGTDSPPMPSLHTTSSRRFCPSRSSSCFLGTKGADAGALTQGMLMQSLLLPRRCAQPFIVEAHPAFTLSPKLMKP